MRAASIRGRVIGTVVGTSLALATTLGAAQNPPSTSKPPAAAVPVHFSALAIVPDAGSVPTNITITRWSTDAERDQLITALKEKGQKGLVDAMSKMPRVGSFGARGQLGVDLRFVGSTPQKDGTTTVTLITDRAVGFAESYNQARSVDYPFTLIDLSLKPDGKGEGTLSVATKISIYKDTGTLIFEHFTTSPIRLISLEREK